MAKTKNSDNTKCCQGCEEMLTHALLMGRYNSTTTQGNCLTNTLKIQNGLTQVPALALLSIYSREMKTRFLQKNFIAALFLIVPNWKLPK